MMPHQFKPTGERPAHLVNLPYGARVRVISRPDQFGRVYCRDLTGKTLGLIPLAYLERL